MACSKPETPETVKANGEVARQLSRLFISTSSILKDKVIEDLMKKNRKLEVDLWLERHNGDFLFQEMSQANNMHRDKINCSCRECVGCERWYMHVFTGGSDEDCEFTPWFERKLAEIGITFSRTESTDDPVLEDVHLVDCGAFPWGKVRYGNKLRDALDKDDPEIKKLDDLFEILDQAEVFHLEVDQNAIDNQHFIDTQGY